MRTHVSGYEAYKAYLAIRQHFTKANFDFFAGNRIRFSEENFNNRGDNVFFHKLAEEYPKGDLMRFFAVNHLYGYTHISQYCGVTFREWEALMGGLEYHFESDCKKMVDIATQAKVSFKELFISRNGGIPLALQMVNGKHIKIETFCLIDLVLNGKIIEQTDSQVTDMFAYPALRMKIVKYQPWIIFDKDAILRILIKYI